MFSNAGVCLGVFWDFIGKYNFIKDVGKLMSYIGNVHSSVGKYYGKTLGLVWDFFVSKILISCLPACRRLLFPLLHLFRVQQRKSRETSARRQISCWEFNIKSWECLSQYCKISWENVGPSLGFFLPQNTDFMLGIQCKKLGMFIPIL